MTLILLTVLKKLEFTFNRAKIIYLLLILIAMLFSSSATSQVIADFTTISPNTGCGSLVVEFQDLSTGSPNTWRRSECPMITYSTPQSANIFVDTSPVNAPSFSQWQFCAPKE